MNLKSVFRISQASCRAIAVDGCRCIKTNIHLLQCMQTYSSVRKLCLIMLKSYFDNKACCPILYRTPIMYNMGHIIQNIYV